jgi:putative transcriptional regulator
MGKDIDYNVKLIRESIQKSQSEFAKMFGICITTVQNWETGRCRPRGPSRKLLRLIQLQPELVLKALKESAWF